MRTIFKVIFGLILIVIGVGLIVYAQHGLHEQHATLSGNEPFFYKVRDWFVGVGDWFKGLAVKAPPEPVSNNPLQLKIFYGLGIALTAIGALFIIFSGRRSR